MAKRRTRPLSTKVSAAAGPLAEQRGDVLVLGLFQDTQRVPGPYRQADKAVGGVLAKLLKLGDFAGKALETAVIYAPQASCSRWLLVGLGDKAKADLETMRRCLAAGVRRADRLGAGRVVAALHLPFGARFDAGPLGQTLAEAAVAARYNYREHVSQPAAPAPAATMRVTLVADDADTARALGKGCRVGVAIAEAQNLARALGNRPGNEIYPETLAAEARRLARQYNLRCKIHSHRDLENAGMGGILAVGQGSARPPRLIELEYRGRRSGGVDLVLCGKAVTFDSGGLNLKPAGFIRNMKFDKCGGCAVLGLMAAVARLKLPVRVVGLVPAAENMPSHTSYRPDDIIKTYSGKTVEIDNTDAEGRMILSDALAYGATFKPQAMVDLATLTGACVVALGKQYAGLFSNDDKLRRALEQAGTRSGERVWPMPFDREYLQQMRSDVADLKNAGGRYAGACTAAVFLGEFVGQTSWAHIDIAGMADIEKADAWRAGGATGFAVRLLVEYLRHGR